MPPLATHGEDDRRRYALTGRGRSAAPGLAPWPRQPPRPIPPPRSTHPPTTHISARGQEFEEWEAGEVGGERKSPWGLIRNTSATDQETGPEGNL